MGEADVSLVVVLPRGRRKWRIGLRLMRKVPSLHPISQQLLMLFGIDNRPAPKPHFAAIQPSRPLLQTRAAAHVTGPSLATTITQSLQVPGPVPGPSRSHSRQSLLPVFGGPSRPGSRGGGGLLRPLSADEGRHKDEIERRVGEEKKRLEAEFEEQKKTFEAQRKEEEEVRRKEMQSQVGVREPMKVVNADG